MSEQQQKQTGSATIVHRGETRTVPVDAWRETLDAMVAERGAWEPGKSSVTFNPLDTTSTPSTPSPESTSAPETRMSTWSAQVHDADAEKRIKAQHEKLREHGIEHDASRQLYATGTRMADVGYATQSARKAEHENMQPLSDVAHALVERIIAEKRNSRVVTARDVARGLSMNGKLKLNGYTLQEQAIRGLLLRLDSPASSYVFGVRDRLREATDAAPEMRALDKAAILETLVRECERNPDVEMNLRLRDGLGDCFAVVSPTYGEADAPAVLPAVLDALSSYPNVRATSSYDPASTAWEVRAQVHTPTPTERQAVGEPFQGYVSLRSRDNGTGRLSGGGGVLIIACLNASVLTTGSERVSRVHRGRVLVSLDKLIASAARNIHALCDAWGVARADVIPVDLKDDSGKLIPIERVIQGFYQYTLTERRGELLNVLPGRTAKHAAALVPVFMDERRDREHVTRADLAQGLTRYVQSFPLPVQQNAESAVASWLVQRSPVRYLDA